MKKLVFAFVMFIATFLLLSIELKGRPLFAHLQEWTTPMTRKLQQGGESLLGRRLSDTRQVGQQLFNNSLPQAGKVLENVKAPEESLSEAEKKELDSLIKNYSR